MKLKDIFLVTLIAMPLTFFEVSAAGNTDKFKDFVCLISLNELYFK